MLFEEDQLLVCLMNFLHRCKQNSETGVCDNDPTMASIMSLNTNNNLLCFAANFVELASVYLETFCQKKEQTLDLIVSYLGYLGISFQTSIFPSASFSLPGYSDIPFTKVPGMRYLSSNF